MIDDKPKRGRPRKLNEVMPINRPRGRPKGSKNKPKLDSNHQVVIQDNTIHLLSNVSNEDDNTRRVEGGIDTTKRDGVEVEFDNSSINKNSQNNDYNNINLPNELDKAINISNSNNILKNNSQILGVNNETISKITSDKVNENNKSTKTNSTKEIKITPELVIAARRELALSSSAEYACLIDIPSAPVPDDADYDSFSMMKLDKLAAHHAMICNEVDNAIATRQHNLMIFAPPGSAKSTYVDVVCPTHAMIKYPRLQVILASYSDLPAFNQSKKAKQLCGSRTFSNLFPDINIPKDSTAQDNWALSNGSSYRATGIFGDVTSYRCDVLIVDDPIKGREQAESETIRNKSWESYLDNCVSRLKPRGIQIMILTRWHEDDIAGRILPEDWDGESGDFIGRDGRKWRVISLPAIADREDDPLGRKVGDRIWPEWFDEDHFTPFRLNTRTWNSLYQQKPTVDDGDYFLRSNFKRYIKDDLIDKQFNYYGTSDYAVKEQTSTAAKSKPDNTVLYIWGLEETSNGFDAYLIDSWVGKTKSDKWIDEQCNLIAKHKPFKWFGEGGVIQLAIEPALRTKMRLRNLRTNLIWMPSNKATGSKEVRARSAQALVQDGRIYIPDSIEGDNFINECIKFPAGKNDDRVDNLSLIGRAIDQITIKKPNNRNVKPPTTVTPFNRART